MISRMSYVAIAFWSTSMQYEASKVFVDTNPQKEFIENSSAALEAPRVDDTALEKEKDRYFRVIGDLQMQLDFAKRVSKKLGIEITAKDYSPRNTI